MTPQGWLIVFGLLLVVAGCTLAFRLPGFLISLGLSLIVEGVIE